MFTSRMTLHSLQLMLDNKRSPSDLAKSETHQHLVAISDSVKDLLELGQVKEVGVLLRKFGSICKKLGESVSGSEHKEYILQVSTITMIPAQCVLSCVLLYIYVYIYVYICIYIHVCVYRLLVHIKRQ